LSSRSKKPTAHAKLVNKYGFAPADKKEKNKKHGHTTKAKKT